MSLNFACAIVDIKSKLPLQKPLQILNEIGFEVQSKAEGFFSIESLVQSNDEVLIRKIGRRYVLFGECIYRLVNDPTAENIIKRNSVSLYIITQHEGSNTYTINYFKEGKAGPGHQVSEGSGKVWHRNFTQYEFPIPRSKHMEKSFKGIADSLRTELDLVNRTYGGMHGGGNYGIGYQPVKGEWVACKKINTNPKQPLLQEMNPRTYGPRGKPFEKTDDPFSSKSFLSQSDLFYETHHRTIECLIGFRLDRDSESLFENLYEKYFVHCSKELSTP